MKRIANTRRLAWTLLLALPVGGCATFHDRPLRPEASADALRARSLADPRLLRFVDLQTRRTRRHGWDLDTLTLAALYERPDMPIAATRIEVAQAGEVSAREWPNPVFSVTPGYDTTTVVPSPWLVEPFIAELIQTAGKRPALLAQAGARAAAARKGLAVTAWQVRGQVRTAVLDLWSASRRLALSIRHQRLAREYERLLTQRLQAGMISAAAVSDAQLADNQADLTLAADRRAERLARVGLATALAVPESAVEGLSIDFSGFDHVATPQNLPALRRAALTRRPDLAQAGERYAEAQAALRLAVARQYPDLTIGPGYEFDQGENKFKLGISLPLPILNQNQGPIAVARAARRLAALQFEQVQTTILGQIETAMTDWRASRAEEAEARRLLGSADSALARQRAAFNAGQIGRVRLVGADIARLQTEYGVLAAALHERTALGRLEDALYHPFLVSDPGQ